MRPLAYHYVSDVTTHNINDEYMVGDKVLVAPIVNQGQKARAVYLPEGEWVDYWTNEVYKGNQYIIKEAPLETLPLFIKNNSIVVQDPPYDYLDPKNRKVLHVNVYGDNASYTHYLDDGESYDYQEGKYQQYLFEIKDDVITVKRLMNNKIAYEKIIIKYKEKVFEIDGGLSKVKLIK